MSEIVLPKLEVTAPATPITATTATPLIEISKLSLFYGQSKALKEISRDPQVTAALFEVLETQNILQGGGRITLVPEKSDLLAALLAGKTENVVT